MGFSPDMTMVYPQLHPSHSGPASVHPVMGSSSDLLRRTISSQLTPISGGFKEPPNQLANTWDDELHNIVQMNYPTSTPLDSQENSSTPPGQMKVER